MAVNAAQDGRNLRLTVEGIEEPFIIRPLPGRRGQELTSYFLTIAAQQPLVQPDGSPLNMETVLAWAVDGVDAEGEWISDGPINKRILNTLTLEEGQDVYLPAFYWCSVLGIDGVIDYFAAGGGMSGGLKAMRSLTLTLGISPLVTSPDSVSETLTSEASTPTTSTPNGGGTLERLPRAKRSRFQNRKR